MASKSIELFSSFCQTKIKISKCYYFYIFTESTHWAESVIDSQSPSVCLWSFKTPSSGGLGDFWSKNMILILACDDTMKKSATFFLQQKKLDQHSPPLLRIRFRFLDLKKYYWKFFGFLFLLHFWTFSRFFCVSYEFNTYYIYIFLLDLTDFLLTFLRVKKMKLLMLLHTDTEVTTKHTKWEKGAKTS